VDVRRLRVVLAGILLGHQEDLLVLLHDVLERADRLLAADEQRHDHMREDHDVPQGQDRIKGGMGRACHGISSCPPGIGAWRRQPDQTV
jgi:hypothetical protein